MARLRYIIFLIFFSCLGFSSSEAESQSHINFLGSAQMIGGSAYLIETPHSKILIDYGLHYGEEYIDLNYEIGFDPSILDYVILTHAHIDHSGRIPKLYKNGYEGKIFATDATRDIAGVMLEMSLSISQDQESELFGWQELLTTMNSFKTLKYSELTELGDGVKVRLRDAGHIMGSSIIELWVQDGQGGEIKIVATGDMGPKGSPLLRDPEVIYEADYILIESTYGNRQRGPVSFDQFAQDISKTINSGGSVLIPAFVLEKTQKVIYVLGELKRAGQIPKEIPVYVDSRTAHTINTLYRRYHKYYDEKSLLLLEREIHPLNFEGLRETSSGISLASHDKNEPAIYISSSGMLEHANAPKHLEKMIEDPKNLLAIVGWQAPGSLGRKLQDGAEKVTIFIEELTREYCRESGQDKMVRKIRRSPKKVNMQVKRYGIFSSHADACELLNWLSNFPQTKEVFVVHGEKDVSLELVGLITDRLGFNASAPAISEKRVISSRALDFFRSAPEDICEGITFSSQVTAPSDQ